jgi:hypothetical protein
MSSNSQSEAVQEVESPDYSQMLALVTGDGTRVPESGYIHVWRIPILQEDTHDHIAAILSHHNSVANDLADETRHLIQAILSQLVSRMDTDQAVELLRIVREGSLTHIQGHPILSSIWDAISQRETRLKPAL